MNVKKVDWNSNTFGREVLESFKETGFAVVTNHPINQRVMNIVYEDWKTFFAQTEEVKNRFLYKKETQAGWFPPKSEKAKDSDFPDMKEFYHFYHRNEPATTTSDLAKALEKMAQIILNAVEAELQNDGIKIGTTGSLSSTTSESKLTLLRILHYPPTNNFGLDAQLMERASAHEDINLITLLPAATNPGLQVKTVAGEWIDVEADPGSVIVNVGDMMMAATHGYLPSTTHRVVADLQAQKESRYSMPLFLHPRPEVRLNDKYTAGQYLHERLIQLGVLPPDVIPTIAQENTNGQETKEN